MDAVLDFVLAHGYAVVFALVLAEQVGLPIPALPVLLGIGALAGEGHFSLGLAVLVAVAASLTSDLSWYLLGRRRGHSILNLLCRISLEPDSCVRRTEEVFARHGAISLLYAKFVPGLNTAAPPLAGLFRMRLGRFLLWDAAGATLWAGALIGAGWLFSAQLEWVLAEAERLGNVSLALALGGLVLYVGLKYLQRRRFLRRLWVARIAPEELAAKLAAGEEIVVVDLRHALDFEADPATIPGAVRMSPEEIEARHGEIPRDREVILFCT